MIDPATDAVIRAAERVGLSPDEWNSIRTCTNIPPLSADEWREALLSTVEDSV